MANTQMNINSEKLKNSHVSKCINRAFHLFSEHAKGKREIENAVWSTNGDGEDARIQVGEDGKRSRIMEM